MKIQSAEYAGFTLKPEKPFSNARTIYSDKEIVIVKITSESGLAGYGEASPLANFSHEKIADVKKEAEKNLAALAGKSIPDSLDQLKETLNFSRLSPSFYYSLEQALISLAFQSGINPDVYFERKLNGRLQSSRAIGTGTPDSKIRSITGALKKGFTTIKLKVSHGQVDEFEKIIGHFSYENPSVKFRIDANTTWGASGLSILQRLKEYNIEYVEQPVENIEELIRISEKSPLPIAADESVYIEGGAERMLNEGAVKYFIIKPMVLGGIYKTLNLVSRMRRKNIIPVISSSLESVIGRRTLQLIAGLIPGETVHGLSPDLRWTNDFHNEYSFDDNPAEFIYKNIEGELF